MKRENGYIFTNKVHSNTGIMSTVLGGLTIGSNLYAIMTSYALAGEVPVSFGTALAFTAVLAIAGLVLGIVSRTERNKFYFFSYLGIGSNVISLALTSTILYAGAYL